MQTSHDKEKGGVSIFIVIFTALLVTIITASFAQLMVRNQQQASANDLSQSAYDSALAGVEDAKRALVRLQECEKAGDACEGTIKNAFNDTQKCNVLETVGVSKFVNGEVAIGTPDQNQAYTCVKVQLNTPEVKDDGVAPGVSVVVPLKSKSQIEIVVVSWFTEQDLKKATSYSGVEQATFPGGVGLVPLPQNGEGSDGWPITAPALLRTQLIQFKKNSNFKLDDFSEKGTPNARTLFLYPHDSGGSAAGERQFSADKRRSSTDQNTPVLATCNTTTNQYNGYFCQVELRLADLPGNGENEAYLQLQSYYQQYTSYSVMVKDSSGSIVDFDGVQPKVDSTGRASSLFRRVEASVSLRNDGVSLPYPDAALSVGGNVCKNFFITDDPDEYSPKCSE